MPYVQTPSDSESDGLRDYPRDLVGYGRNPPHAAWPNKARIALQFVLNYEEGSENSVLHGDAASETFLSEMIVAQAFEARHLSMESLYEYGSRVGVWRILREFERRKLPLTVFGVSMALNRHPELVAAFVEQGHEIACHGWRWIHHQFMSEARERQHIKLGTEIIRDMTGGQWPLGWYTGRDSPNTKRLVADQGGYVYDSDYYGDDLPFWMKVEKSDGTSRVTIIDQGPGFDWGGYLEFSPERVFDLHGRGIAMSRSVSFDSLEYRGTGNTVVTTVALPAGNGGHDVVCS